MNQGFDILRQSFNAYLCNFVSKTTNYMMCCYMLFCLNGQQPILTLQIIVSCHQIPPNIIYLFYSRISKMKMALHDLILCGKEYQKIHESYKLGTYYKKLSIILTSI